MNKDTRLILETLSIMMKNKVEGTVQILCDQQEKVNDALGRKDE